MLVNQPNRLRHVYHSVPKLIRTRMKMEREPVCSIRSITTPCQQTALRVHYTTAARLQLQPTANFNAQGDTISTSQALYIGRRQQNCRNSQAKAHQRHNNQVPYRDSVCSLSSYLIDHLPIRPNHLLDRLDVFLFRGLHTSS